MTAATSCIWAPQAHDHAARGGGGQTGSVTEEWDLTDVLVPVALDTCVLQSNTTAHASGTFVVPAADPWMLGLAPYRPDVDPGSVFKTAVSTITAPGSETIFETYLDTDGRCTGAIAHPPYGVPVGNIAIADQSVHGAQPLHGSATVSSGSGPDRMTSAWSWDLRLGVLGCHGPCHSCSACTTRAAATRPPLTRDASVTGRR